MYVIERADNVGREKNTTTVNSDAPICLTAFAAATNADRMAVQITNNDTAQVLYLKWNGSDSVAPTITATNYYEKLNPGASITLGFGKAIQVWAINDTSPSASTIATAVELR